MARNAQLLACLLAMTGTPVLGQEASQWSGAYAGLALSRHNGDMIYEDSPGDVVGLRGDTRGVILGYGVARGAWIFGGELAWSKGEVNNDYGAEFGYRKMLDVKARAGYAFDNLLVYGTVGISDTRWNEFSGPENQGRGLLLGAGVDYLVTRNLFVGAEVVTRDLRSDYNGTTDEVRADLNTLTLRLGLKF
jgi:outer membrane immunogenic protein